MSPSRPRRFLRLLAPVLVVALAASCNTPPKLPPGADNPGLSDQGLREVNPLDVAVLPVANQTGIGGLPLDELRRCFHAGLVERHYSPLALDYVDGRATEASYQPGASEENAVFEVVITGWDDRHWRTHARLVIDADVWLRDAAQPDGARALWGGHVSRTLEMGKVRDVVVGEQALLARTVQLFSEEVLASLPARRPELASAR
jgi:hypothetical protein